MTKTLVSWLIIDAVAVLRASSGVQALVDVDALIFRIASFLVEPVLAQALVTALRVDAFQSQISPANGRAIFALVLVLTAVVSGPAVATNTGPFVPRLDAFGSAAPIARVEAALFGQLSPLF